ncbi:hypothetical protein As57867_006104, partial [Aphanomyces stellatus]
MDLVPPSWAGPSMAYYGGNPLCFSFKTSRPYPQMPFSYYDACQSQTRFAITLDRSNVFFAILAMSLNSPSVCQLSPGNQNTCQQILSSGMAAIRELGTLSSSAMTQQSRQDIVALNIQFVQMATQNKVNVFLRQPILSPTRDDIWSFFGWLTLYDWGDGKREVLYLEGDMGNLTLMSDRIEYLQYAANALELPRTACLYVWYLTLYVTILSGIVTIFIIISVAWTRFDIHGTNLFMYNRVFGSVWIGRPLLFLRGLTAIVLLSTSSATLSQLNGVTYFLNFRESYIGSFIISRETIWIQYVLSDTLIPFTGHNSRPYARLSSAMAFCVAFCIDRLIPTQVTAAIQRTCAVTSFRRGIVCTSGHVDIGSIRRVQFHIGIQCGSVVLGYILIRLYYRYFADRHSTSEAAKSTLKQHHALTPACSTVFLNQTSNANHGTWDMDAAACIMSGMVPVRNNNLFDLKIWALIDLQSRQPSPSRSIFQPLQSTDLKPVFRMRHRWLGCASLIYMATSIAGSYAFIVLTQSAMSNDFWWASFDTNTQTYLCNWFNLNLQLTNSSRDIELATSEHGTLATTSNQTVTLVNIAPVYANLVQDEANSIPNVIQS